MPQNKYTWTTGSLFTLFNFPLCLATFWMLRDLGTTKTNLRCTYIFRRRLRTSVPCKSGYRYPTSTVLRRLLYRDFVLISCNWRVLGERLQGVLK